MWKKFQKYHKLSTNIYKAQIQLIYFSGWKRDSYKDQAENNMQPPSPTKQT